MSQTEETFLTNAEDDERQEIVNNLVDLFQGQADTAILQKALDEHHPADIAFALDDLDEDERRDIFGMMDPERLAEVLEETGEDNIEEFVETVSPESLAAIVEEMSPDEAVDILDLIDDDKAEQVIKHLSPEHAEDVQELREYDPDTAGGIMTNEYIAATVDMTVDQVISLIRKASDEIETLSDIPVCSHDGRLKGIIAVEDLVSEEPDTPIAQVMEPATITIGPKADQELCARYMHKYDLRILPVIDTRRELLGIITFDDIIDVMDEEANEDMYRLAGVGADRPLEENAFARAFKRLPWLAATLLGTGLLGPLLIQGCFEDTLKKMTALIFFMPVVMALGGNTGMQSSTITVRGLATGEVQFKDIFWMLRRELSVALVIAVTCCLVISLCSYLMFQFGMQVETPPINFMLTVSIAIFVGIVGSVLVGTTIPMVCHRLGVDPALAAGPFITTLTDISMQVLYLAIATLILING